MTCLIIPRDHATNLKKDRGIESMRQYAVLTSRNPYRTKGRNGRFTLSSAKDGAPFVTQHKLCTTSPDRPEGREKREKVQAHVRRAHGDTLRDNV
jgi:hypothetical protein